MVTDPALLCFHPTAFPRDSSSLENTGLNPSEHKEHICKMATTSASTPNVLPIVQGSGGGNVDLLMSRVEGGSIGRHSCATITIVYDQGDLTLPMFRKGVDMDISHAYLWNSVANLSIFTTLSFWFMTGPVNDERVRIWLFNLHRYACEDDCKRTLTVFMSRVKLIVKTMKTILGTQNGRGLVELFAEYDLFQNVDNFWDEFKNLIEGRKLRGVHMSQSLEAACSALRDGTLVNAGYLLEAPTHVIY